MRSAIHMPPQSGSPLVVALASIPRAANAILLTDQQRTEMLANGAARARGDAADPLPVVKLHTLDAHATWLLTDLADDGDTAYGLIDMGLGFPELGHVQLSMLGSIIGPNHIPVRVDPHFKPRRTLSAYTADALRDGSIND